MFRLVCGETQILSLSEEKNFVKVYKSTLRCKSWTCPKCRAKKAKRYAKRTFDMFQGVEHVRFLTVTFDRSRGLLETWIEAAKCWNRFRTAFVKRYGKVKYCRVVEPQRDGYPHYHILLDRYIPPGWLTRELKSAGFGKIRHIRLITSKEAFYYVLKYLKKEWRKTMADEILKQITIRRYNTSREVGEDKETKGRFNFICFATGNQCVDWQMERITEILAEGGIAYAGKRGPNCTLYYRFGDVPPNRCRGLPQISRIYPEVNDLKSYLVRKLNAIRPSPFNISPGALPWPKIAWKAYVRGRLS